MLHEAAWRIQFIALGLQTSDSNAKCMSSGLSGLKSYNFLAFVDLERQLLAFNTKCISVS